jgi:predicted nucleic acid-binding protein
MTRTWRGTSGWVERDIASSNPRQVTVKHARVLLDTSVVINYPAATVGGLAETAAISTITLAELAYGLHTADPLINAARCASVRLIGRDPQPRRFDLLITAFAITAGYPLLTRNAADFQGIHAALSLVEI